WPQWVPHAPKTAENCSAEPSAFPGTMPCAMNWVGIARLAKPACITSKELFMRNRIFAVAAIISAIGAPIAAQAQSEITTGAARGNTVVITESDGIVTEQRPAFRE